MTSRTSSAEIGPHDGGLYAALLRRGLSRRDFLKFSAAMTGVLALPASYAPRIAEAVAAAPRLPVIWLRGQDCGGNTNAFLRATKPTVADLVLDSLSVDYHETLMAAAGATAEQQRTATMERYPGGYLAIVEGSIPTAGAGVHCLVGGRPFRDVVREVSDGALATIAIGTCAFDGGFPAAHGGSTGAVGVGQVVSGSRLVNLPGCPLNVENLTATIVYYLTSKQLPPTDSMRRPLFAYGNLIHNQCERRAHFEFGEFATAWGDEASQKGWCLYKMGCKGPETYSNCPTVKYADGTSWPVRAGHGCVGCHMPGFWDAMSPFYERLPEPVPFLPNVTVDQVGQVLLGAVAAATVVHGGATTVKERLVVPLVRRRGRRAAARKAAPPVSGATATRVPGATAPLAPAAPSTSQADAVAPVAAERPSTPGVS